MRLSRGWVVIQNYIDGRFVTSQSKQVTSVINPCTEEVLGLTPHSTAQEVSQACEIAQEAFLTWRRVPAQERIQYLFKLKALLEENSESLSRLITIESGKTLNEARGDLRRGIQMIEAACGIPSMMLGTSFEDIASGIDCVAVRRPMGVFAAITPFNFPAMISFWFWPFAVAAGNTFVLKPSERVPLTQIEIFKLIEKAGFPKGVVNLVQGGREVVETLCTHPLVQGISFVGSTPVAKIVYSKAASHGKRVQALGGAKNFMVVLPDAVMDKSVSTALESIIGCAGQRCLAGSVVLSVGKDTAQEIENRMVVAAKEIIIGDGLDPMTQLGPLISEESKLRVSQMIDKAVSQGAKLLFDGRADVRRQKGFFMRPTVLGGVNKNMEIAKQEVFGPVICLSEVPSLNEAINTINSSEFANTTTLFTTNGAAAREFCYQVDPSMIGINIGVPAPMSFFSFGGTKNSFFGDIKAHGAESVRFFTDSKTTMYRWLKGGNIW
ncbi:MAG: CoA-acylating methylmalonate-semialdehyde dehydrogenase [Oligoflexia bacterium]|nr:CoA-acylating methylmalonate-semialdehyde dehydrogenase [Oligoflexia bacterium]